MATLNLQVEDNLDDVHERNSDGFVTDNGTYILQRSSSSSSNRYWGGYRFTNATWPAQGDTIGTVTFSVNVYSSSYDDARSRVRVEDAAAPARFTTGNYDISNRPLTTAGTW